MEVSNHLLQCQIEGGVFPLSRSQLPALSGGGFAALTSEKQALVEQVAVEQQRASTAQTGHISRDGTSKGLSGGSRMGTLVATSIRPSCTSPWSKLSMEVLWARCRDGHIGIELVAG